MKKIYLSLSGGLGNQLFTYGFAKYLTKRYNYSVSIDLSFFKTSKLNLDLKHLQTNNIQFEYVFGNNYKLVKYLQLLPKKIRFIFCSILSKGKVKNIYFESGVDLRRFKIKYDNSYYLDNKDFNINSIDYIYGYSQNIIYLNKIIKNLNKEIVPISKKSIDRVNFTFNKVKDNTCAMHIRCDASDDYDFKMLNPEYFNKAIKVIKNKNIHKLIIFTDNLIYANNIILQLDTSCQYEFISDFNLTTIEEFYLLSKFKNIIISISTFSWFAAYLNNHSKDTIVIPSIWFKNNPIPNSLKIDNSVIL